MTTPPADPRPLRLGIDRDGRSIEIESGRVRALGAEPPTAAETLDGSLGHWVPGAVNAHTHIYSGLAPFGMPAPKPPPENFVQILERVWWRLDRALDADSLRASARCYVAEALLAGTTTLIDHHESPSMIEGSLDVLADACEELGIRAALCFGATERNRGRPEAVRGLAECRRFIEENRRPAIRGLVGLHASFTVSDETIREAGELCAELGVPLHVHVAEDTADLADARRRGYAGPFERLVELGALPAGSLIAHGVHLDRSQVEALAGRELWLMQNPRSNHGNGVGYPKALSASPRVALGTDGYPSDLEIEAEVLRELATQHGDAESVEARLAAGHRLASELFKVSFSPLAVESVADVVLRTPERVEHVVVAGRVVVQDGRLLTGDREEIRDEAARAAPELWKRMEEL